MRSKLQMAPLWRVITILCLAFSSHQLSAWTLKVTNENTLETHSTNVPDRRFSFELTEVTTCLIGSTAKDGTRPLICTLRFGDQYRMFGTENPGNLRVFDHNNDWRWTIEWSK